MYKENFRPSSASLEDNLKKALTELLILHLLSQRDYFIGELSETLKHKSGGVLKLVFPYSAIYRLQQIGYITNGDKRIAHDGRKRQFFSISPQGQSYYKELLETYQRFISGVNTVLTDNDQE